MSRSFVMGSIAGVAVGLVGLASVSLMTLPSLPDAPAATAGLNGQAPEAPLAATKPAGDLDVAVNSEDAKDAILDDIPTPQAGSEFMRPKSDEVATVPAEQSEPEQKTAPSAVAAVPETAPTLSETAPAAKPDSTQLAPVAPVMPDASPDASASPTAQVGQNPPPKTTQTPELGSAQVQTDQDVLPTPEAIAPDSTPVAGKPTLTEPASPIAPDATDLNAQGATPAGTVTDLTQRPSDAPDQAAVMPSGAGQDGETAAAEDVVVQAPQPGLSREVPGVKVNRLPTIGGTNNESTTIGSNTLIPEADPAPTSEEVVPALLRFAAKFQNPENKPVLAVLLLDVGAEAGGLDSAALSGMPVAVTIAVDPLRPDASAVAAAYRKAGFEVAILAEDLPKGSNPADLEVAYQSYVKALPESVALTGLQTAEFQRSSQVSEHLAALLAADGRGLISYVQGLNPAERAAQKAHIGHASVDKVFGYTEDNSGTMGRELDRVAFSAEQKGYAVIALPTTPDAVTGLIAWITGPSATGVAIAPVSAVMSRQR